MDDKSRERSEPITIHYLITDYFLALVPCLRCFAISACFVMR